MKIFTVDFCYRNCKFTLIILKKEVAYPMKSKSDLDSSIFPNTYLLFET